MLLGVECFVGKLKRDAVDLKVLNHRFEHFVASEHREYSEIQLGVGIQYRHHDIADLVTVTIEMRSERLVFRARSTIGPSA